MTNSATATAIVFTSIANEAPARTSAQVRTDAYNFTAAQLDRRAATAGIVARYYFQKAADFVRAAHVDSLASMPNTNRESLQSAWTFAAMGENIDNAARS